MIVAGVSAKNSTTFKVCPDTTTFSDEIRVSLEKTAEASFNILRVGASYSYEFSLYAGIRFTYTTGKGLGIDLFAGGYAIISYSYSLEFEIMGWTTSGPLRGDDLVNESIDEKVYPLLQNK